MKINQISIMPARPLVRMAKPVRRADDRPGLKAALLGIACAVGILAVLGLLYAAG